MSPLHDPIAWAIALPPLVLPLFVLVSGALEYIVPPYFGDMFMLLGFFLAGQGAATPWVVFLAALVGSTIGAWVAYLLGRRYGLRVARKLTFTRRRHGSRDRLRKLFARFGERVLVVNRFIPFVRGLLLYGAGALDLRMGPCLVYAGVSNLAWVGILTGVGMLTAGTWMEIQESFRRSSALLGLVVVVAVVAWAGWTMWRATRADGEE